MKQETTTIEAAWDGPYAWPGFESENNLRSVPKMPGVYLQTFDYQGGYLICGAGITRRPIPVRLKEHTPKYMDGKFNVLDIDAAQRGIRKEVCHGWGYERKHRSEFEERKSIIVDAARKQLAGYRIFVADVGIQPRVLERLEASIMGNLYEQPPPICDMPDRGMHLAGRRLSETQVTIKNIFKNDCAAVVYGLPAFLEI